jgi:hypothetical protein
MSNPTLMSFNVLSRAIVGYVRAGAVHIVSGAVVILDGVVFSGNIAQSDASGWVSGKSIEVRHS